MSGSNYSPSFRCVKRRIAPDKKQVIGRNTSEMSDLVIVEPADLPATERHERMAQQARASEVEEDFPAADEGVR